MKKQIVVVDYGLGNIRSVKQSLNKIVEENNINALVKISKNLNIIKNATHTILPGQGAFESCLKGMKKIKGLIDLLSENTLIKKKPFLGICVGMQLLANKSYENGKHIGLGWIPGEIKKLPEKNNRLPHMGWNNVAFNDQNNQLIKNTKKKDFYFVHSYYFSCKNKKNQIGTTKYGLNFASIVSKENIYGVQFHPEKSSEQGLNILRNFIDLQ